MEVIKNSFFWVPREVTVIIYQAIARFVLVAVSEKTLSGWTRHGLTTGFVTFLKSDIDFSFVVRNETEREKLEDHLIRLKRLIPIIGEWFIYFQKDLNRISQLQIPYWEYQRDPFFHSSRFEQIPYSQNSSILKMMRNDWRNLIQYSAKDERKWTQYTNGNPIEFYKKEDPEIEFIFRKVVERKLNEEDLNSNFLLIYFPVDWICLAFDCKKDHSELMRKMALENEQREELYSSIIIELWGCFSAHCLTTDHWRNLKILWDFYELGELYNSDFEMFNPKRFS